jgi:hypothetical protein
MSNFIIEQAIFQEADTVKIDPKKAVFRMVMQTVDEVNQNKRIYPRRVLSEAMDQCSSRMKRRAFFGELDHPCPQGNDEFDTIRQTTVMLKEVSHIIRDYEFRGNKVIGEIETTSTPNGQILLGLLRDHAGVGLSMRGLAELDRKVEYNEVKSPLTIISFDSVSLPSHSAAVVDFNEMKFESHLIQESAGLICIDGKCFLPEYFDKLVERKIITFFDRWV